MHELFYGRLNTVHFVGIGGIGMSGIAEVLLSMGFRVHGSDIRSSEVTERLQKLGAVVHMGHSASHINGAQVVVTSTDIRQGNPEVEKALEEGIPVIPRAEMLAELMRLRHGIAVSGSHGKTTTTSLVASVLQTAQLDPTVVIGGKVNHLGSNAKAGLGQFLVAEADESDGSFLLLSPSIAAITNIDPEHLDYWKGGINEIKRGFISFAHRLPFYGLLAACIDCPEVRDILPYIKRRVMTYGFHEEADYRATDIVIDGFTTTFSVHKKQELLGRVCLHMCGTHHAQNALAAIAISDELNVPFSIAKAGLENFQGVQRRFTRVGEARGITVIDDYGHHPTEIKAVLAAARSAFKGRRIVVFFQPHRYTRLHHLMSDFATCFSDADSVVLTDVYSAGEAFIPGATAEVLAEHMNEAGLNRACYGGHIEQAFSELLSRLQPGDVLITLGAGNITHYAPKVIEALS